MNASLKSSSKPFPLSSRHCNPSRWRRPIPVAERVRLKKELQQHYKTRSKLSHGEHVEILADDLYQPG
jgi:hypothetical protein